MKNYNLEKLLYYCGSFTVGVALGVYEVSKSLEHSCLVGLRALITSLIAFFIFFRESK